MRALSSTLRYRATAVWHCQCSPLKCRTSGHAPVSVLHTACRTAPDAAAPPASAVSPVSATSLGSKLHCSACQLELRLMVVS